VTLTNVRRRVKEAGREVENPHAHTFDVYLDPETGRFLKAISRWPEGEPRTIPARAKWGFGGRQYGGLPEDEPGVTMAEAIAAIDFGRPDQAREITAYCLLYKDTPESEPRPVWGIDLRGFPPFLFMHSEIGYTWHTFDATTGRGMGVECGSAP